MKSIYIILILIGLSFFMGAFNKSIAQSLEDYDKLKAEGKLPKPNQTIYNGVYPDRSQFSSSSSENLQSGGGKLKRSSTSAQSLCTYLKDASFVNKLPKVDDDYVGPIALDFTFKFFGETFTSVYINTNGNITFGNYYTYHTSSGFPLSGVKMIAPFYADVDNRGVGDIYYKADATKLVVIWEEVGYYNSKTDKKNTFQLIITNGSDPILPDNNNVAFYYGNMEWTTGGASGSTNGLGGTAATVGFNLGDGQSFYQEGRFNKTGTYYDGPGNETDGIGYLESKGCFLYNVDKPMLLSTSECMPPGAKYTLNGSLLISSVPSSGTLTVCDNGVVCTTYSAPFSLPLNFSLHGLDANGETHTVTATFSPGIDGSPFAQVYKAPQTCTCSDVTFSGLPEIACPNYIGEYGLLGEPIGGTFSGAGISGTSFIPANAESGTNAITYQITGCPSISKKIYIPEKAYTIDNVLSSTVTTFSDNWPLDFAYANKDYVPVLTSLDAFSSGSKGIWRGEGSYAYVKERLQSMDGSKPKVNIAEDGTFNEMPIFDWTNGLMSSCYTEWRNGNTITKYNPYNFEVENRDILGIHSAALYGYDGNLTTAVAANARNNEIAFESFEEYSSGGAISPGNLTTGNFTVYTAVPQTTDFRAFDREYEVVVADGKKLTLNIPPDNNLIGRSIRVYGSNINGEENGIEKSIFNYKNIYGTYTIQSVAPDPNGNAERSLIVLDNKFTNTYLWKGKISVPVSFSGYSPQVNIGQEVKISDVTSHSGKLSLAIRGNVVMEQERLSLNPGNYVFSSWVSIPNPNVPTFKSASNAPVKRGIQIQCLNAAGSILSTSDLMEPSGAVIERWQKVENEFSVPSGTARVVVRMFAPYNTSSDYTYLDDIRIFPSEGSMKSYVYNKVNYKLSTILDDNNYATFYYYDQQGNLYLTKKETERGIMTIQEVYGHQRERYSFDD